MLASEASNFLVFFRKLPILTQWAVTILVPAGFIVHVFAYNARTVHDAPSIFPLPPRSNYPALRPL